MVNRVHHKLFFAVLLALYLIGSKQICYAQQLTTGKWRGVLDYINADLPFEFLVETIDDNYYRVTLINGEGRIEINNAHFEGDSLIIPMFVFSEEIYAFVSNNKMSGYYIYPDDNYRIAFTAQYGKKRFDSKAKNSTRDFSGEWKLTVGGEESAWFTGLGLFVQNGNHIEGTIMTKTGDLRHMEGIVAGRKVYFSGFDGAHAFYFEGSAQKDGSFSGSTYFDPGEGTNWVAVRDPEFLLQDPFEINTVEPGRFKIDFESLATENSATNIENKSLEDKVVILQIIGTWCPNSMDETEYLVEWYLKNKIRGVEIISITFDGPGDNQNKIDKYRELMGVDYPIISGGEISKSNAANHIPFLEKINAFPTMIIVDKRGYARYIHGYFNGPATGKYYKEFDEKFNELINGLLEE